MNKFKGLLIFTSGLAVGSVVAATLLKKYYEEVAQAEIDSVKEIFTYRKTETGTFTVYLCGISSWKNEAERKE